MVDGWFWVVSSDDELLGGQCNRKVPRSTFCPGKQLFQWNSIGPYLLYTEHCRILRTDRVHQRTKSGCSRQGCCLLGTF